MSDRYNYKLTIKREGTSVVLRIFVTYALLRDTLSQLVANSDVSDIQIENV